MKCRILVPEKEAVSLFKQFLNLFKFCGKVTEIPLPIWTRPPNIVGVGILVILQVSCFGKSIDERI